MNLPPGYVEYPQDPPTWQATEMQICPRKSRSTIEIVGFHQRLYIFSREFESSKNWGTIIWIVGLTFMDFVYLKMLMHVTDEQWFWGIWCFSFLLFQVPLEKKTTTTHHPLCSWAPLTGKIEEFQVFCWMIPFPNFLQGITQHFKGMIQQNTWKLGNNSLHLVATSYFRSDLVPKSTVFMFFYCCLFKKVLNPWVLNGAFHRCFCKRPWWP